MIFSIFSFVVRLFIRRIESSRKLIIEKWNFVLPNENSKVMTGNRQGTFFAHHWKPLRKYSELANPILSRQVTSSTLTDLIFSMSTEFVLAAVTTFTSSVLFCVFTCLRTTSATKKMTTSNVPIMTAIKPHMSMFPTVVRGSVIG